MQRSRAVWRLWFSGVLGLAGLIGLLMIGGSPDPAWIGWLVYLMGAAAILYRPRYGIYLVLFFGLISDNLLIPWFPFIKNFSSRESLLFLNDAIIVSPLETYIFLIFVAWLVRGLAFRKFRFYSGELFWPVIAFLVFVILGVIYGVSTGGNLTIALWEARPLFYLVALIILTNNLLENREQVRWLIRAALLALFVKSLIGTLFFSLVLKGSLNGVEAMTEHAAAVQLNTVFVFVLASWLYKSSWKWRMGTTLMVPFVLLTYIATQRRAAMIALVVALLLLGLYLFMDKRKAFYLVAPPILLIGVIYLAAFWNSSGALGLPARAIKSVVMEDQASVRDQASNSYRVIENMNTGFTVHQKPLTGVGFGQKFYVPYPMPDISFFEWWQYFPHNSIIWIWLKMGVGGFFAMLYMVGSAIMLGVQVTRRMPPNIFRAIALYGTLYLMMHFIYAYVDISWDTQSMLYIGAIIGLLSSLERIVAQPVSLPPTRWAWQSQPLPEEGLVAIMEAKSPR